MSTNSRPRVALCGISLESNAFSPVANEADFRALCYLEGEDLLAAARGGEASTAAMEMTGFVAAMDVTGPWDPIPIVFTASHPWGPVEQGFFERVLEDIVERLRAAGSVDAVYVANHGAMVATGSPDPDGDMLSRLREAVGPDVPIVATLDLHANISEAMVEAADVLVAYQTNPHVDMLERGEEAAHILRAVLGGAAAPQPVFIRMPIVPPSVTLLTREGPYADLIDFGQRRKRELAGQILNVSILGNFAFSDTPFNGIGIVVTGRRALEPAQRLAREIAERCWADRARFRKTLTPLDDAVRAAVENGANPRRPALIFSDAGDNPGGGGGGDTVELLRALIDSGARGVLFGSFHDPALVADALAAGEGAAISAVFNRNPKTAFAERLEVPARVAKISSEPFVGRLGIYAGREVRCQPACALEIGGEGGILVVAISNRYQTADPMFFEHLGLDIAAARTVCVKSRGHFRAGFTPWFPPERVVEVDTAGLTSPVLERLEWKGLPRPVHPLDEDADWVPPNW
ncbi:MAG: M81 family metallopeptidase [Immundisolibacterales bacterium]|nr:M81 family metallopeptidase [Immundisolibacterales bacterium]